jgi:L-asparagine transporter-like permease
MAKLENRHIQMIALGGAIGTGLFFGLAKSIPQTGPSILLSYLIGGVIMYIIMRALGEMVVHEPNSGAFSYYANKYVGGYLGFLSGWYAWFEYTIVCMLEVTAVTMFLDLWLPHAQHWLIIAIILSIFFFINIINVNLFGEFEFWFAGIKVVTIILMILFAIYLIFFNHAITVSTLANINANLGHNMFSGGFKGFMFSLVLVVFSFGGTQFIGIAAADAKDPSHSVPKAIRGVIFRIVLFYVGTIVVILCLYPWYLLSPTTSPFVDVFNKIGISSAANIMNLVAITAALSAFNSCLYSAARVLASLAKQGAAPKKLGVINSKNIPHNAVIFTSLIIAITVVINYLFPEKAIIYLIAIATTSIIVTWITIIICHAFFRMKMPLQNYRLPLFPWLNIIAFIVLASVVVIMTQMEDMQLAVYLMPLWIIVLTIAYFITRNNKKSRVGETR